MVKLVGPNKWKLSTMSNLSSSKGASKKCNLVIDNARRHDPLPTFREQARIIIILLIFTPFSCLIEYLYLLECRNNEQNFGRVGLALPKQAISFGLKPTSANLKCCATHKLSVDISSDNVVKRFNQPFSAQPRKSKIYNTRIYMRNTQKITIDFYFRIQKIKTRISNPLLFNP